MSAADLQPGFPLPDRPPPPAPLLPVALGIILGIVADSYLTFSTAASVVLVLAGMGLWLGRRRLPPARPVALVALTVASAGVGSLRHAVADRWLADDHVLLLTADEPRLARLQGRVVTVPRITEPRPDVPRAYGQGPKTRFVIEAMEIAGKDGPIPVSGRVAVTVKGVLLSIEAGDVVQMTGWLYRPSGPKNPGEYDWALHQRRSGLWVGFSCSHAESVIVVSHSPTGGWASLLGKLRARLRGYLLDDAFGQDEPGAGVMAAMVLGERSAVPRAMNEAFVKTGNAHFLAASGMHVGWLALMGWGLMRLLGAYYRTTAVFVGLLILAYVVLAEPRPSIMRAGIIGLLGCASVYLRGSPNAVNWLACSAIVILLIDPEDLFRPAFQYSFLAVLALIHLRPRIAEAIASRLARTTRLGMAWFFDKRVYVLSLMQPGLRLPPGPRGVLRVAMYWMVQLGLLAFSAWSVVTPLSCYHFNNFTPWGWLGTLLLWFVAFPVTCIGFVTLLFGVVFPSSGAILGPLLGWTARCMVDWVEVLARLPGTMLDGRSPSLAWVLAVYGALWLWVYRREWTRERLPWPHTFKVLAVVLFLWWLVPPRWVRADPDALQVWVLAVGDGSGTVVELPNGETWLYDFGTRSPFAVGRLGAAFLKHRGIRKLDTVIVSHPNFDHFSGIETLAQEFDIGRVVLNDQFHRFTPEQSAGWYFLRAMDEAHVPIELIHGPHIFEGTGGVVIEAIWPPAAPDRPVPDSNNGSTVLRLTYQGRSVLLPGDITEFAMASLMAEVDLKADVLVLPHHGSVVHTTEKFIAAVDPRVVVRSSAQRQALTTNGIEALVGRRRYFNTADVGCVHLQIEAGRITAASTRPRRRLDERAGEAGRRSIGD